MTDLEHILLRKALHSRGSQPSASFCGHGSDACPFCGGRIDIGHDDAEQIKVIHVAPLCVYFEFCANAEEFFMFGMLKAKSDHDHRERN